MLIPLSPRSVAVTAFWRLLPAALMLLLLLPAASHAQSPTSGLANGFEIDGTLYSNSPVTLLEYGDDWLTGLAGPGNGVLLPDGTPINPLTTFHILDLTKNDDLNIFSGNFKKVFHNPNDYEWTGGSVPQKDDIQNGLIHIAVDALGDHWFVVGGDRRSNNGTSYIDFEFLQNRLTDNPDGTFTSLGPDSGRTVGDLLLTIELVQGGAQAQFIAQRWEPDGVGGFTYNPIPFPAGAAFVASNKDSAVTTTYDAFGGYLYDINQFGEAAVNLDLLLPAFGDCFGIATVFVRTKSSASSDAGLEDFIEPFQLDLCLEEIPPVIECPSDISISCAASIDPGNTGTARATDNCDADPVVTYTDSIVPGSCDQEYIIHRIWTAVDVCGNSSECTQQITVTDDTTPVISSGPADIVIECISELPAADTGLITATDPCGAVTVTHVGDVSNGLSCPEVITRTYRAADDCGHSTEFTQLITIDDTTPPAISGPGNITVQCRENVPAPDTGLITASDNCGTATVSHVDDVSDNNSCPEIITRTYRAVDACGNASTHVQLITIHDDTAPVISAGPADTTVSCAGEIPPADIGTISASDNCGTVEITHVSDIPDGGSCPQVITRTYQARDDCDNTATFTQLITVDDDTPPVITGGPTDVTVSCIGEVPDPDTRSVTASDNCGGVTITHLGDVSDRGSCPETITRTYQAEDGCGNTAQHVQVITVADDIDPVIFCPDDIQVECAADIPTPSIYAVTASDNCGEVTVVFTGDVSNGGSCPEIITRTYRATDACGNSIECSQIITVHDVTAPVISSGPGPVTVQCIDEIPLPNPDLISATDNCGAVTVVHVDDVSDHNHCPEIITRTYRAVDACMNSTDWVQTITVDDTTPPVITSCPDDRSMECPEAFIFDAPTATDNCDPNPQIVLVDETYTYGPEAWTMSITRTWRAEDECGNRSAECSQTLHIHCEADHLCTFTQGFYGNFGGYFNGESTLEIIRRLLASEPLVVGKPGRSLTIPYKSAECIISRLPSGTTPATLPPIGDATLKFQDCQASSQDLPVDSQGKFENVLLGQTITLSLNCRYNYVLMLFPLSPQFCTQKALPGPDGLYGTGDDIPDPTSPPQTFYIPNGVLNALDYLGLPPLVAGLLELANRGLAGWDTGGASLSLITDAVDAINNGFNGCRFIVDCGALAVSRDGKNIFLGSTNAAEQLLQEQLQLPTSFALEQNYPNPFNPSTSIMLAVPTASDWTIAIYDVTGALVQRFSGSTGGAEYVSVLWDGRDSVGRPVSSGVYLYRARAGSFTQVKKMILLK